MGVLKIAWIDYKSDINDNNSYCKAKATLE